MHAAHKGGAALPAKPKAGRAAPHKFQSVAAGSVPAGQTANLAELENLTEETLLNELKTRFRQDVIYTYVGEILVTVNPYKWIKGIYDADKMSAYHNMGHKNALAPHIFALSDLAFQAMTSTSKNQVCVISGESGAGKTEAAKLFVKQLVQVSHGVEADGLEQKLIQVNPLLEAFGNAKTGMNDNSSRFGKYVSVKFNREGAIKGALMTDYLLEKSRVVHQGPGEQNFHVFYIVFAGISAAESALYKLADPAKHAYINGNAEALAAIKSKQLQEMHHELMECITFVGFTQEQKEDLFHLLSGVIHLGDVAFQGDEAARIGAPAALATACEQLGVNSAALECALTRQLLVVRGEETERQYKHHEAVDCRDAAAKALYGRAFSWIIQQCNKLLGPKDAAFEDTSMGILDIFGFESFNRNSFEQLCINLTNEQLQFFFNEHIFAMELTEYAKEGISGKNITYQDNQPLLDLLLQNKPLGLLAILDEESNFPKATDQTMIDKFHQAFEKHKDYVRPRGNEAFFGLRHYAGCVTYEGEGFLEKNRDTLAADIVGALRMSDNSLVRQLFNEDGGSAMRPKTKAAKGASLRMLRQSVKIARSSLVKKKKRTVGALFKDSLLKLMSELNASAPWFVRCVKPNMQKAAGQFDDELVLQQLRYTGMLETTRIRREGYASRPLFADFIRRYKFLGGAKLGRGNNDGPEPCRIILKNAGIDGFQIGKTKVFLRYYHVDELNEKMLPFHDAQTVLAKWTRMFLARRKYQLYRQGKIPREALVPGGLGGFRHKTPEPEPEPEKPKPKPWFFGCCSRKEAEKVLKGAADGTFLIRVAESRHGYSLSRVHQGAITHFRIQDKDGAFEVVGNDAKLFQSLEDIVAFHEDHPVAEDDDYLLHPAQGADQFVKPE